MARAEQEAGWDSAPPNVLGFVAAELERLAMDVAALESSVGEALSGTRPTSESVVQIQDLDRVRQTLENLAELARIADTAGRPAATGTLAATLSLGALRERFLLLNDAGDGANLSTARDEPILFFETRRE